MTAHGSGTTNARVTMHRHSKPTRRSYFPSTLRLGLMAVLAVLACMLIPHISGCAAGGDNAPRDTSNAAAKGDGSRNDLSLDAAEGVGGGDEVELDLTLLSETVMFAEVNRMQIEPEKYIGKLVRISGRYAETTDESGQLYRACVFTDSTACCTQVFEFVLADEPSTLETGDNITVVGRFEPVIETPFIYLTLFEAHIE